MTDSAVLFAYHLFWGVTVSLVVSLFAARQVATQATINQSRMGNEQITLKVSRAEFLRTWMLYTLSGSGTWMVVLLLWETKTFMENSGYIS